MRKIGYAMALALSMSLSGCGGGGGGGSGGGSNQPAGLVSITRSNAQAVTGESVSTAATTGEGSELGTSIATSNVKAVQAVRLDTLPDLAGRSEHLIRRLSSTLEASRGTVPSAAGVVRTATADCDPHGSGALGTVFVSYDDAKLQFDLEFHNCYSSDDDATYDGALRLINVAIAGDPDTDQTWHLSATMVYDKLSFAPTAGVTESINGSITLQVGQGLSGSDLLYAGSLSVPSLTYTAGGQSATLSDYTLDVSRRASDSLYTLAANGSLTSTRLGGRITIQTITPIQGIGGANPTAGQVRIAGLNDSSCTLTVLDGSATLEVDENGDGVADQTINTTWDELA